MKRLAYAIIFLILIINGDIMPQHIDSKNSNRLSKEKSPYLLQHQHNPVDWYPWGEDAFLKAEKENKPVFLSIGYSTCHWCHVMAHESFEDEAVARLMNDAFVCVKVDREERPDIDNIYMTVCQMMTGSGGWPLTVIMTPDKKPFFAGTYFPKTNMQGRIGMMELIPKIKDAWEKNHDDVVKSSNKITSVLADMVKVESESELSNDLVDEAYDQLARSFDSRFGGFGGAPKFPTPQNLLFLLRRWKNTDDKHALNMVEKTLSAMSDGGVYDHLGYGFHRYSTDHKWLVPHFEKMLYDQAMISLAYIETYQATGKKIYKEKAKEIFTYVTRDLLSDQGGFYSAEDADSEGEEGLFYFWTKDQIDSVLTPEEAQIFVKTYHIGEQSGEGGKIPHLNDSLPDSALLVNAKKKLFSARSKRVRPFLDNKILTDWNGLMIAALARGALVFQDDNILKTAKDATDFILENMRDESGRLLHTYLNGSASINALADDYAFLIFGLLNLYEAGFDQKYLDEAQKLNAEFGELFWDEEDGGYYLSAADSEELLVRVKDGNEGPYPSSNSVAMLNLLRLGAINDDTKLLENAKRIGAAFSSRITKYPSAYTHLLSNGLGDFHKIMIIGERNSSDVIAFKKALATLFIPNSVILFQEKQEKATVQVCTGFTCLPPISCPEELLKLDL